MMQDPGTDNLIEAHLQVANLLNRKLVNLKIPKVILCLEAVCAIHTRCADIDAGDLSRRPAQRMFGGLRSPAAGDDN